MPVRYNDTHTLCGRPLSKPLELDPLLAEAHAAMGWLYSRELDWDNAQKSFRRAIELNATLSHIYVNYVSTTLRPLGKLEEAERLLRTALRTRSAVTQRAARAGDALLYRRPIRGSGRHLRAHACHRSRISQSRTTPGH